MVDPQMAILGAILGQPWVKKQKFSFPLIYSSNNPASMHFFTPDGTTY